MLLFLPDIQNDAFAVGYLSFRPAVLQQSVICVEMIFRFEYVLYPGENGATRYNVTLPGIDVMLVPHTPTDHFDDFIFARRKPFFCGVRCVALRTV